MTTPANPLTTQEGGDHYKKYRIQPLEYAMVNGLDGCQHNVVKYVTRFRDKGGREDLRKARHYLDLLEHFEYDYDTRNEQLRREEETSSETA